MNAADVRERDRIAKMLRRRPVDPDAPLKPTTPELMTRLSDGIRNEYDQDAAARIDAARAFLEPPKENK